VVLKIIKHCKESLPTLVAGSLLGMDVDDILEVTNCFPFPSSSDDSDGMAGQEYQMQMMKALRDVNVDNNQVGWYQSTCLGTYCSRDLITTQVEFQETIGTNAVVIIFDPFKTTRGSLSLQAFRLTDKFMAVWKAGGFSLASIEGAPIATSGIFEEVPIRIHNSHVFRALLHELAEKDDLDCDFDRLDLGTNPFLEKNLQFLIEQVDELSECHQQASYWKQRIAKIRTAQAQWTAERKAENERRVAEGEEPLPEEDPTNPLFKPLTNFAKVDRLDTLLLTAQIGKYCDQVNNFVGQSFSKLFLAGSLHKE